MAAAKSRRAPAVIMSTPPPPSRSKSGYSQAEKQGLLQNFDLEVADKTQFFRSILARTLASFNMREESEILSIPRELRKMTLGELEQKWGGGWAGTLQKIRRESFEKREQVREKEEEEKVVEVKGKRKRNTTADSSPARPNKNTRRDAATPISSRSRPAPSSSVTRSKAPLSAKRKPVPASGSSKGPSSLPQNHIFNPTLPPTPLRSAPSRPPAQSSSSRPSSRQQTQAPTSERDDTDVSDSENESDQGSEEDDLPDPEALEAKLLSKSMSKPSSRSAGSKKKRAPSLIFRQSLAPGQLQPIPNSKAAESNAADPQGGEGPTATIALSDGRTISFNPLNLTPGRVDRELDEGGVSKEEKVKVSKAVHEEVFRVLQAQMEKWRM